MSEDSGINVDFSPTDFIVGLSSLYVLFNYSAFLGWAASLSAPIAGYATVIVYLLIIVGVIEAIALAILAIVVVLGIAIGLFKLISHIIN